MGQRSSPWDIDLSSFRDGIPAVDPADLKKLWKRRQEIRKAHPGVRGFGRAAWECLHADMPKDPAINYRVKMLQVLTLIPGDLLAEWQHGDELDDCVFRVAARIPMTWIGEGIHDGFPFDMDAFFEQLRAGRQIVQ
jgi:hypothetical protein